MTKYLLAIDQGTTTSRALILKQDGTLLCQSQCEFTQFYPENGYVEHDPQEIWKVTLQSCCDVIAKAAINANAISGIGITNQRETTIIWDRKTGEPIYPAIVWQDRRTADLCHELKKQPIAYQVTKKTGLLIDSYWSATKIQWILDNVAGSRQKAKSGQLAFGTIDSFLLWKLTKGRVHATDITNASRTLLFNIVEEQWDQELLDFFQIPRELLPEVDDNCHEFGVTDKSLFGVEIPITAMIGDQQAALVGQTCFETGMMKCTFGTGGFMMVNTGQNIISSKNNLIATIAYRINGKINYALEGSIFNAGTSIKWLRDKLHVIKSSHEVNNLLKEVDDTDGVYFVPAFTGLGAPHWAPNARGAILGLTRNTEIAHIVRAAVEAVCYQTQDLLVAMKSDGLGDIKSLRVDGGMAVNDWMLQFLADMIQINVQRPQYVETTALGAAYLAGLGAGLYHSLEDIKHLWKSHQIFTPSIPLKTREKKYHGWQQAVKSVMSEN